MQHISTPPRTLGLRHVALNVFDVKTCVDFYCRIFQMKVDWQPDSDNAYLTSGTDNLALHRVEKCERVRQTQRLDHIGFCMASDDDVNQWYTFLKEQRVHIIKEPKTHRDGARSLYCADPEGNVIQLIHIPAVNIE